MRWAAPFCLLLVIGIVIGVNVAKQEPVEAPKMPPKADVAVTRVERLAKPADAPFVPLYMGGWK